MLQPDDSNNLASETTAISSERKKFALIVGINNSSTSSYLSDLENAEEDALAICWALQQPACKFTSVKLLTADKARTHNVIDETIKLVQQKREQDFLLFYFIGHGQPAKTKEGERNVYFVTYDFDPHQVKVDKYRHISMRWLKEVLYEIDGVGGVLIVLDCCYAGDMISPSAKQDRVRIDINIDLRQIVDECLGNTTFVHNKDRLRVILTSTRHNMMARERVLTSYLLPVLQGQKIEALDPNTGDANIHSLFMYLREKMPHEQLPNLAGEFAGNWILASYPDKSILNLELARKARENERWNELPTIVKEKVTEAMSEFVQFLDRTDVSSSQSFDHLLCKEASFADLDLEKVKEFFNRDRLLRQRKVHLDVSDQDQKRLEQLGLLKETYPTYGALLCFGKNPQHWVSSAITRCVKWNNNDSFDELQDSEIFQGDLLSQFESVRNFLRRCLRLTRVIGREGSTEQWEIPFRVLEEALANALVHREYANQNGFVQVQVFSDRIEISSPGAPPSPVTLENLGLESTSHPRNFQIASIFYLCSYFEQAGSGIPRMRSFMEKAGLRTPEFLLSPTNTFKVILYRPEQFSDEVVHSVEFGALLSQGIEGIAKFNGITLAEAENRIQFATQLEKGLIDKYQQGVIPTRLEQITSLARACVRLGGMSRTWLRTFVEEAGFPTPELLVDELYSKPSIGESKHQTYEYDIALSYAWEDRTYAETIANILLQRGIKVFYDKYESSNLWGKDLYSYLSDLYQNKAQYCMIFLSEHYVTKVWTTHERQAVQARAFRENKEYILPIRLDDSTIPGFLPDLSYLSWHQDSPETIAEAILEKLGNVSQVPRTIETILRENVAIDHTRLFGVDALIDEVKELLMNNHGSWVISLFGEGGIGKTALAYEIVSRHAVEAGFTRIAWVSAKTIQILPDSTFLRSSSAELRWISIIKKLADQLGLVLGYNSTNWFADFQQRIRSLPASEKCLLIIDNLETIEDLIEAIHYLCGTNPDDQIIIPHKILITTRYSILGQSKYIIEKQLTGLSLEPALKFIRELGNENIEQASDQELVPIASATDGNPLLIKLFVTHFLMSHLPLTIALKDLQTINSHIGKSIIDYLHAESLSLLQQRCGTNPALKIMKAFCPLGAGETVDYYDLFKYSGINDEKVFQDTLRIACDLSLIRPRLNSKYSIHSLLWSFVCDVNP